MLRFLGIATLVLMVVCLAVGASIALADTGGAPAAVSAQRIAPNDISNQDI
jgi:hypothetical protein